MALLRFDKRGEVLDTALAMFGVRRTVPLGVVDAGPTVVRVGDMLPVPVVAFLKASTRSRAAARRIVRNAGKRAVDRIKKAVRRLDLISPRGTPTRGLYLSSWRAELRDITGVGLSIDLAIVNAAPYALYVHPKGTPKSQTYINEYLPSLMKEIRAEIAEDIFALVARIVRGL